MVGGEISRSNGPLHGIRVLDLTRVLAGPWASQVLGDYGAEVIKVERPETGDDTRHWGPPWRDDRGGRKTKDSAYFLSANRNKRSITIDLSNPAGAGLLRDLAAKCDVLMENFRVGTMRRFELGYEDLYKINSSLIYCSISAYGQTGSRADKPGYDAMIQASGGLMSITGELDGPPQKAGVAIADIMAGMYAATAILGAIVERKKSGVGQHLDVPLYDSQVAWLANQNMNYLIGGEVPKRMGTAHPNLVPYQVFKTIDGYLMLAVGNNSQFIACCECLRIPEVAVESQFATNADRVENRDALVTILSEAFRRQDTSYWLNALTDCGVPAGPINTVENVLSGDYAVEREFVRTLPSADGGTVPTVANPVRFSRTPIEYQCAPPMLGEHTDEVLAELLGLDAVRIDELRGIGAI